LPGSAPIAGSLAPGKATSILFSRRTLVLLRAFIDEHCEGRFGATRSSAVRQTWSSL
jgi:hypothetical protein